VLEMPARRAPAVTKKTSAPPSLKSTSGRVTRKAPAKAKKRALTNEQLRGKRPKFDELGYEIDYRKVDASRTRGKRMSIEQFEKECAESARKREIMGTPREAVSAMTSMAWDDRVATIVGKPYHKVTIKDYEEVHRLGHRFEPGEFVAKNMSKKECDRITKLAIGSAFRL
jgi:hypothetical protein